MSKMAEIQKKDGGVGTIYQNKAELIAAAIVTIFRIILILLPHLVTIAAAMAHSHGNSAV